MSCFVQITWRRHCFHWKLPRWWQMCWQYLTSTAFCSTFHCINTFVPPVHFRLVVVGFACQFQSWKTYCNSCGLQNAKSTKYTFWRGSLATSICFAFKKYPHSRIRRKNTGQPTIAISMARSQDIKLWPTSRKKDLGQMLHWPSDKCNKTPSQQRRRNLSYIQSGSIRYCLVYMDPCNRLSWSLL